ncbi:hypothetical protein H0H92_014116 [Tricholoma furcatifolium]|nr:hypothetical protein H0H92_014116 [Tricholoma furcatifolium]
MDTTASTPDKGKVTTRSCQGVMQCDNPQCKVITRPQTSAGGIEKQLDEGCQCGARLSRVRCNVKSTLTSWEGGVYYKNGGLHFHPRPSRSLHASATQERQFVDVVKANPAAGPVSLVIGAPSWDPYAGLPSHWNHEDRPGSDSELVHGNHFESITVDSPTLLRPPAERKSSERKPKRPHPRKKLSK